MKTGCTNVLILTDNILVTHANSCVVVEVVVVVAVVVVIVVYIYIVFPSWANLCEDVSLKVIDILDKQWLCMLEVTINLDY